MNEQADQLIQEIGNILKIEASNIDPNWVNAYARIQFMEGATKDTYSYIANDEEQRYFFPENDFELEDLFSSLRKATDAWKVCLVSLTSESNINIDFEYQDESRWSAI
ncbi:hypothetical protein ACJJIQ_02030 [Microbulbifer sp. ANSA003]|uniref:hypothetical protein n=1 Tax=Microbulbifer sp. ANSA003 TaxID=3243360 RepID=UPI0040416090